VSLSVSGVTRPTGGLLARLTSLWSYWSICFFSGFLCFGIWIVSVVVSGCCVLEEYLSEVPEGNLSGVSKARSQIRSVKRSTATLMHIFGPCV